MTLNDQRDADCYLIEFQKEPIKGLGIAKVSGYHIPEKQRDFNEWLERLPIPYSLREVENTDKKYESLKAQHESTYKKSTGNPF